MSTHLAVALLVIVCVIIATFKPVVRAGVAVITPSAYLISPPDPIIAERGEQTYRGWRSRPTPAPTPLASPVPPPAASPEPPVLAWPVRGPLSTYFSARHPAIDIVAKLGASVRAACSGIVIWAGWKTNGGGNVVDLRCDNGLTTSYNHMSAIRSRSQTRLATGDVLGLVGATGHATGPHLHFAVFAHGHAVNPLAYL
jgi:murein DD-endopeptidase MepM/ murein hydrolase activator NlpD